MGDRASACVQARFVAPPGLSRRLVLACRLVLVRRLGLACGWETGFTWRGSAVPTGLMYCILPHTQR
jgi:hypothetical protein